MVALPSSMGSMDAQTCALRSGILACAARLVRLDAARFVHLSLGSARAPRFETCRWPRLECLTPPPTVMSCTMDPFSVLFSCVSLTFCALW
ncbi:hypothetical protein C1H46_026514 [Malus baccata]|uniref:Uncharacterized protein n=1 Tax=Malus baccata TaxID=106549 RepID=A0A540LN82_MALBA|nr:hypothetical protein C1H46_026514 [Malus baccata]